MKKYSTDNQTQPSACHCGFTEKEQEVEVLSTSVLQSEKGRNILSGSCSIKHTGQARAIALTSCLFSLEQTSEHVRKTVSPAVQGFAEDVNVSTKPPHLIQRTSFV